MKAATVFLGILCLMAAMSGCAGKGDGVSAERTSLPPTETQTPTSSPTSTNGTDDPNSTQDPLTTIPPPTTITDPAPTPPVANLTVDRANGTVPFDVTFTVDDANESGTPEYEWTLDFGDGNATNGTGVPAAVPYSYTEIGNYTVNLTLKNEAGESEASVNVTAEDFAAERMAGEWETGLVACMVGPQNEWDFSDYNGTTHVEFPINNTTWNMTFFAFFEGDASEYRVDFYDEDSNLVENRDSSDNSTINGTVPMNTTFVVLWACNESAGGSAEYVSAPQEQWDRQRIAAPPEDEG